MAFSGIAVIIGASSGIGKATAKLFAQRGCTKIAIGDIAIHALTETKDEILAIVPNIEVLNLACDVTSEGSVHAFIEAAANKFGRIDYAVNCAGILTPGGSAEISAADFDHIFSVNARGMWLCQRAEIKQMLKQDPVVNTDGEADGGPAIAARGAIVNVSSMAGLRAYCGLPGYTASKAAVQGFTKADGMQYAKHLIRINSVCPGPIDTAIMDLMGGVKSDAVKEALKEVGMGRAGKAEEVAETLLWLTSGRASFVTATHLAVNGGMIGA